MEQFFGELILQWKVVGLFFVAFLEAIFLPLPPDVFIPVLSVIYSPFLVSFIATSGSVCGAVFSYFVGKRYGTPLAIKFFGRQKVDVAHNYFKRWGVFALVVSALTPVPFSLFVLLSGVLRLNFFVFFWVCVFARFSRYFIVAFVGKGFFEALRSFIGG